MIIILELIYWHSVWDTIFNMKFLSFLLILLHTHVFCANRAYESFIIDFAKDGCLLTKENIYLTKSEIQQIENKSKTKVYGGLALRYITTCPKNKISYHYVDSHIVRTQNETVVVSITKDKIDSFEVTSFNEPAEYLAPKKWYNQFIGLEGNKVLKVRDQIDGLSGATLTVNASVKVANKILALHELKSKN